MPQLVDLLCACEAVKIRHLIHENAIPLSQTELDAGLVEFKDLLLGGGGEDHEEEQFEKLLAAGLKLHL